VFIVEQRPWLGIWLTICFSGIRGEATEKEWGNDVLTMQPMDWQICKICKYANGLVGWIGWLRRSLGCATTLTRDQGGDTRTHILHFWEDALLSLVFVCATKKNQNKSVCACFYTDKMSKAHDVVSLIVHSVENTSHKPCLFCSCLIPVHKNGKGDWCVCEHLESLSHQRAQQYQPYWPYIHTRMVCARSLVSFDKLNVTFGG